MDSPILTLEELDIPYDRLKLSNKLILQILKGIDNATVHPDQTAWNNYWSSYSAPATPRYLQREHLFRYQHSFIHAAADTEQRFADGLKERCFDCFKDVDYIAEFGCGSGVNLLQLRKQFPDKPLYAFDWSPAAVQLVSDLAVASVFDMTKPQHVPIPAGKLGVLTCGALEQLGDNFGPFLVFLLGLRPAVCLHLEPFIELYDQDILYDYLAVMYHRRRNYLGCYLTMVKECGAVLCCERTGFGCWSNEGYSVLLWQPKL